MKEILLALRRQHGLSQSELAERLFVTRQAVSRWECGETIPGIDTLKRLASKFQISLDDLLGVERKAVCQSCGMPLEHEDLRAPEPEGEMNAKYCKWCYSDGNFTQDYTMDEMVDHCASIMDCENVDQCRTYLRSLLATLDRWK